MPTTIEASFWFLLNKTQNLIIHLYYRSPTINVCLFASRYAYSNLFTPFRDKVWSNRKIFVVYLKEEISHE